MLPSTTITCPYCGEAIDLLIDDSAGDQQYIEDCQVCCRPITISVTLDETGEPQVGAMAEDDV